MRLSLSSNELSDYVGRQIDVFFPDGRAVGPEWRRFTTLALERCEYSFSRVRKPYYLDADGETVFNHLNTDQYAAYLYLLSNAIYRDGGDERLAAKVYALNKALHSLDVFYAVELPNIFVFVHPVGTVIGRATYGDFLCVYQNCTIGGDLEGNHPELGQGVVLFGGARVIGRSLIGSNCLLSAGCIVQNRQIPDDSVVFGISPNLVRKKTARSVRLEFFGDVAA